MKTSESIKHIAPALLVAQQQMTFAAKDSKNPHFKNTYAGLPAVIDAVKEHLNRNNIVFIQTASPSDDGKLHLCTRLLHITGEWIEDTAVCAMPKQDAQGFGSCMTYLRRYTLASFCGLYQEDDDGEAAKATKAQPKIDPMEIVEKIDETHSIDELRKVYTELYKVCSKDKTAMQVLEAAKDKRKTDLEVNNDQA
jgi:hypothetical protein